MLRVLYFIRKRSLPSKILRNSQERHSRQELLTFIFQNVSNSFVYYTFILLYHFKELMLKI